MSESFDISKGAETSSRGVSAPLRSPKEQFAFSDNEYNISDDKFSGQQWAKNDRSDMLRMGKRQELMVSNLSPRPQKIF